MICLRCKIVVRDILSQMKINLVTLELGEMEIAESISGSQRDQIDMSLKKSGLELIDDKKGILTQKIKSVIIELVHYSEMPLIQNLSGYLSEKLGYDYTYLSNLFSDTQGSTIEKFYISHKIERVKELLVYDELTLTEIARRMRYSSLAHLSAQFKKVTGLTVSHFKKLKDKRRSLLEDL
jgi:YesN/AraC family two-component response regulator